MRPITLTTGRLRLRPLENRDVDAVHAACQDPEILRWIALPEPYERTHAEEFVLSTNPAGWREDTVYNFGAFTRQGVLTGAVGLARAARPHSSDPRAEIGFWTVREQRRRGYAAEAARAVADWAFTSLCVERLEWLAQVGNEGSRAVARRVGFVMEGVQRARIAHRGTQRDAWSASLLPSDLGHVPHTPYLPARG